MPITTAAQSGHRFLHHYQRFSGGWPDYLEETLRDQVIYMPSPSRFNDPWDCKPWFDLDALENADVREQHIAWFVAQAVNPRASDAEEMRNKPGLLKAMVTQCSEDLIRKIDTDYRVYCLTPSDENLLMWSHYAENHTGICLRFDTHVEPFLGAFEVSYRNVLPVSTLPDYGTDAAVNALLVKSDVWAYENEFRLIAMDEGVATHRMPSTRENKVALHDGALAKITVGCECKEADRIVEMVRRYQPRVAVRQAIRHPHRYGIGFNTLHDGY